MGINIKNEMFKPLKKNILLVDDEENMRSSASLALRMAGYETETAKDGQEALNKIMDLSEKGQLIDLIITDIVMPEMDGLELIDQINRDKLWIPVVAITGDGSKKTVVELLRKGCVDYINKPFEPKDLVQCVNSLFEKRLTRIKGYTKDQNEFYHDSIDDLPSRQIFYTKVSSAIHQSEDNKMSFSILCVGLDRFSKINSNFGFDAGFKVLNAVGERLKNCLRSEDTMAKLYSNEFVIMLPQIEDQEKATLATKRILEVFDQTILFKGYEIFVTLSVGICIYPNDGKKPETLLKNASSALQKAKKPGGNNIQFYNADMRNDFFDGLTLENKLCNALKQNEFLLHYQPLIDLRTGNIIGMEALLRWNSPELGLLSPGEFIPIAEETGLIVPIGNWVLRKACEQNLLFQKAGFPPIRLAVNVSARQFQKGNLLEMVKDVLKDTGLAPDLLEIELTETTIMDDAEDAINTLTKIKSMGVRLSIDDFGTGYSSLSYLKRLPIDTLKIDRFFVCDVASNPSDAKITKAIITMAHGLGFEVVAEGVEKQDQLNFLQEFGCDAVQGYFFSPPVPCEEFAKIIQSKYCLSMRD